MVILNKVGNERNSEWVELRVKPFFFLAAKRPNPICFRRDDRKSIYKFRAITFILQFSRARRWRRLEFILH